MAIQRLAGVTGRIGNVIHYKIGEKYYSRAAPKKFKQTKATKKRAGEFGRASGLASAIRQVLLPVIPEPSDRKMQGRLVGVVFQWLSGTIANEEGSIPDELGLFQFSETNRTVRERWKIVLNLKRISSGELQIEIPAFIPRQSIVAPASTVSVTCTLAVGSCDPVGGTNHGSFSTKLNYEYNNTEADQRTIPIEISVPESSLVLAGVSIEYMIQSEGRVKRNKNKAYMPAGIVEAVLM